MSSKSFFLLSILLLAPLALGSRDPECEGKGRACLTRRGATSPIERLRECNTRCQQKQGDQQREYCQKQCQDEYEKERQRYEERGRGHGGSGEHDDPRCVEYCTEEHKEHARRQECVVRCTEQGMLNYQGRQGRQEGRSPYVFEDQHFFTRLQTQHGRLRILQKFTDRSQLLKGIENYRVAVLEAQPQTFVVPSHWDAESLVFVARGRGTVSSVRKNRRESFNVREGDIFRVKAGTTTYLINRDNNEKLVLVKLIQPVNTPGEFEGFFGAGGENPESFYRAFSDEILEAAFNTRRDRLERIFGQQRQGVIIKASQEQIRSMSQHQEGGIWPFGGESKGTHNLYEQHPTHSNQYGQHFEVDASQFRQLRDLDVTVSLANISQGAMTAPFYNSKATKITIVTDGEGYFEMACPHLSQSQSGRREESYDPHRESRGSRREESRESRGSRSEESYDPHRESRGSRREESYEPHRETKSSTSYQTVRSRLKVGTVVVVPAGHPFVAVASNNQNLQLLCFEVNAYNNERYTLAGSRNVFNQLEREAKQLAFGVPAREVDDVFGRQTEEFFFRGPQQQREGRSDE